MPTRTKRETLKFIRIKTGSNDERVVTGKKNFYGNFSIYDQSEGDAEFTSIYVPKYTDSATNTLRISPVDFFRREGFELSEDQYKNLVFVIDGEHTSYNRATHDLRSLSSRVYTIDSNGTATNLLGSQYKYTENLNSTQLTTITFRINPTSLTIQKRKLFQKLRTRGGWAFQHWGPEIGEVKLRGTTGNLMPDPTTKYALKNVPIIGDIPILSVLNDERPTELNSAALAALRKLEKWYDEDQNEEAVRNGYLTVLEYRSRVYVGHFSDFKLDESGEQPFQLFYDMTFVVHYDASDTSSATGRARSQVVRNTQTLDVISRLKGSE